MRWRTDNTRLGFASVHHLISHVAANWFQVEMVSCTSCFRHFGPIYFTGIRSQFMLFARLSSLALVVASSLEASFSARLPSCRNQPLLHYIAF